MRKSTFHNILGVESKKIFSLYFHFLLVNFARNKKRLLNDNVVEATSDFRVFENYFHYNHPYFHLSYRYRTPPSNPQTWTQQSCTFQKHGFTGTNYYFNQTIELIGAFEKSEVANFFVFSHIRMIGYF